MATPAELVQRYRLAAVAVALSAALHAAVFVGMPKRIAAIDESTAAIYSASLDSPPPLLEAPVAAPPPPPAPKPRPVRKPRPKPSPEAAALAQLSPELVTTPEPEGGASESVADSMEPLPAIAPREEGRPEPELVALAQPALPVPAPAPPQFPVDALPADLSISYRITSAFADGHAEYSWRRDGDNYRITGEAEAEGFFTLFLEGQITQESRGTVSAAGLKPERFSENRPNASGEGLEFDWDKRQVTQRRGDARNTTPLADNTVDWLSMIFQLAHVPPKGESMDLQVFTQRKLYQFRLQVLGVEEIEIPLGRVKGLHLRHVDPKDAREVVDVWLGVDHHYLPVKLRFPVAKNRLMVEQVATRVTAR